MARLRNVSMVGNSLDSNNPYTDNDDSYKYPIGSDEQRAVWHELDYGSRNIVVNSVAGSGKTFLGVEWCKQAKDKKIAFVAFNKHIADELKNRLGDNKNVDCMTYHSLGFKIIRQTYGGRVSVDQYKVDGILDKVDLEIEDDWKQKQAKFRIRNLVGLAKQYGARKREELEVIVDHHDIDMNGNDELIYDWVPKVLDKCIEDKRTIDFDDMVWLPKELNLRIQWPYDVMLIDEAQDTNLAQQWIALNSSKRLVVIGDKFQAIYGFRGSDNESMNRLGIELAKRSEGMVNMELTVTRRCPKSHIELANRIVPQIKALDTACVGSIETRSGDSAYMGMAPGDLVVSRVNAELLGVAYKLLKMNIKAIVRGRDIGKGIEKLIDKANKLGGSNVTKVDDIIKFAGDVTMAEVNKYLAIPKGRGEMRASNSQDRFECLVQLSDGVENVGELKGVIVKLFADFDADGKPNNAVVLGTVHRTKGLESNRVWILRPDLIPHPMAKKKWEYEQELNLAYVSVTRSKRDLIWVGNGPSKLFVD